MFVIFQAIPIICINSLAGTPIFSQQFLQNPGTRAYCALALASIPKKYYN
jgi:hypothetical protein